MSYKATSSGPGFMGFLTLIFITLKLTGVIAWSWLWVLCPLWIGITLILVFILLIGIINFFL